MLFSSKEKLPIVLGGEHSITPGSIRAFSEEIRRNNTTYILMQSCRFKRKLSRVKSISHASAIKRCLDYKNVKVVSFGIRNLSEEEMDFYKENRDRKSKNILGEKDRSKHRNLTLLDKLFKNKNVYITFDVDGFDSSIMPATGTPEPGGMLWEEV